MRAARLLFTALLAGMPMRPVAAAEVPDFLRVMPVVTVQEAFADSYGQVLLKEFAGILEESADAACLASKKMTARSVQAFGTDFLVRGGQRFIDIIFEMTDIPAAEREFRRLAGVDAVTELRRLVEDPAVARYVALSRPAQLDSLVDRVVEEFERYAMLTRIRLTRHTSPLMTGSTLGEANRSEQSTEESESFAEANDSLALKRFRTLAVQMMEAIVAATDQEQMLRHGPTRSFPGADAAFRDHCIPTGR